MRPPRLALVAVLGSGTARGAAPDPFALDEAARAAEAVGPPIERARVLVRALTEVGLVPAACADAIRAPATDRLAQLQEACEPPSAGEVFSGPAAALVPEMDPADHLVARLLLGPAVSATRGTSLEGRYRGLAVDAAVGFALARGPQVATEGDLVVRTTGNLDQAAATQAVDAQGAETNLCGGGIARLVVRPDGRVTAGVGSGDADGCMAEVLTGIQVPKPADGGYGLIDVWRRGTFPDLGLPEPGSGDLGFEDPLPPPPRVEVTTRIQAYAGPIEEQTLRHSLARYTNQLRYCYEQTVTDHPPSNGEVTVKFAIAPDGRVRSVTGSAEGLPSLTSKCVYAKVQRWAFPEVDDVVVVTYAITFSPG